MQYGKWEQVAGAAAPEGEEYVRNNRIKCNREEARTFCVGVACTKVN